MDAMRDGVKMFQDVLRCRSTQRLEMMSGCLMDHKGSSRGGKRSEGGDRTKLIDWYLGLM